MNSDRWRDIEEHVSGGGLRESLMAAAVVEDFRAREAFVLRGLAKCFAECELELCSSSLFEDFGLQWWTAAADELEPYLQGLAASERNSDVLTELETGRQWIELCLAEQWEEEERLARAFLNGWVEPIRAARQEFSLPGGRLRWSFFSATAGLLEFFRLRDEFRKFGVSAESTLGKVTRFHLGGNALAVFNGATSSIAWLRAIAAGVKRVAEAKERREKVLSAEWLATAQKRILSDHQFWWVPRAWQVGDLLTFINPPLDPPMVVIGTTDLDSMVEVLVEDGNTARVKASALKPWPIQGDEAVLKLMDLAVELDLVNEEVEGRVRRLFAPAVDGGRA